MRDFALNLYPERIAKAAGQSPLSVTQFLDTLD
jgi:hypothetical protein